MQQLSGQLGSANDWQASFEKRMKPIEKSTTEQTAGDLQALETATEAAAASKAAAPAAMKVSGCQRAV